MDTRNGHIIPAAEIKAALGKDPSLKNYLQPMTLPPTKTQMARIPPKVGRNDPCPCNSGKKFKKCCMVKTGQIDIVVPGEGEVLEILGEKGIQIKDHS